MTTKNSTRKTHFELVYGLKIFDRKEIKRNFKEGDTVLLWDKRREKPRMHQKFDTLWLGPYKI
jgi:hypothetical protein